MITNFTSNLRKLFRLQKQFSTLAKTEAPKSVSRRDRLQFSKARLSEFGELPQGEIPDALRFDRAFSLNKLQNGVRVATEPTTNTQLASVSVVIKAGTRQECQSTSGVAQYLERLNLRGTATRTRDQVDAEIESLGGNLRVQTSRELTSYTLTFAKENVTQAVEFLGDILLNSVYNKTQLEAEKQGVYRQAVENHRDQYKATIEAVHYTAYRDHYFSQPIHGIRENLHNITVEQVQQFHKDNYVGKNIVVVGTGNVNQTQFNDAVAKSFGKFPAEAANAPQNSEKPFFTPSMLYMRDDEMTNVNIGVFFQAPTWTDPDFFSMHVFKHILGDYRADQYTGQHLNTPHRQYNTLHSELGMFPDISIQKCNYFHYSDNALFGNYFHGNEVFANQMLYMSQGHLSEMSSYLNQVEVYRARNTIYNELLEESNSAHDARVIGNQITYLNRRVPRSEIARRISNLDANLLQRVATRWFWDKELAVVAWGPIHGLMAFSHYNRPMKRSTLGWYANHLKTV